MTLWWCKTSSALASSKALYDNSPRRLFIAVERLCTAAVLSGALVLRVAIAPAAAASPPSMRRGAVRDNFKPVAAPSLRTMLADICRMFVNAATSVFGNRPCLSASTASADAPVEVAAQNSIAALSKV